jgi:hypothetical protein
MQLKPLSKTSKEGAILEVGKENLVKKVVEEEEDELKLDE